MRNERRGRLGSPTPFLVNMKEVSEGGVVIAQGGG